MFKQLRAAVMSVLVLTMLTGLIFPLAITGIAQVIFPKQANGSLIVRNGRTVGSELIGQTFTAPGYFHPRPSAADSGYDAGTSGGTNLGPSSDKLINGVHKSLPDGKDDPGNYNGIKDLLAAYRKENGLPDSAQVPVDAVTRSASGLDPHISPANAAFQLRRVARTRGFSEHAVRELLAQYTEGRQYGILGEPRVNVLMLNLALDEAAPGKTGAADQS
ncbi:MAG: K(+)-transporting ATPase subunit C [Armatimonadetes bacterium]|nr:K(+)-transporting ATPase subunit C [Armatimonadota bacterium]